MNGIIRPKQLTISSIIEYLMLTTTTRIGRLRRAGKTWLKFPPAVKTQRRPNRQHFKNHKSNTNLSK